jgi:predicted RNA-binding protein with PIN domain
MILVLDGFNVLYKFPEFEENMARGQLEQAMRGLTSYMVLLRKSHPKIEVHIFFDGRRSKGDDTFRDYVNGIHTYYSIDQSADYLIREFVESKFGREHIRVVSSDKQVRSHAKAHRCELQSSEEFYRWFEKETTPVTKQKDEKPDRQMSRREVEEWMKLFRLRKNSKK